MTIFQGEIYWIDLGEPQGSEPAYLPPCVVVQNDALNQSQIGTVIVCPLTTNLRRAKAEVLNVEKSHTKFDIIDKKIK